MSKNSLDPRSKAAGENAVAIVDQNNTPITQTTSPTVRVKLNSPWPGNQLLTETFTEQNVLGITDAIGDGLNAAYYNNRDLTSLVFRRIDSQINFNWGGGSPNSRIGNNTFSARWTGYVLAPTSGEYTFYGASDDGIRIWVNNKLVVDSWYNGSLKETSGNITLSANVLVPIKVEYYEYRADSAVVLSWSGPNLSKRVVEKANLFTKVPDSTTEPAPVTGVPIGNTLIGTKVDTSNTNFMNGSRFTMGSSDGKVASMSVYVGAVDLAPRNQFQTAIYTDANGKPGTLVAKSVTGFLNANSWNTVNVSANLKASTNYWFMYNTNGTNNQVNNMKYSDVSNARSAWSGQLFGTWPATFPQPTMQNVLFSIFANYTPTTTTTPIPTLTATPTLAISTVPPTVTTVPPTATTAPLSPTQTVVTSSITLAEDLGFTQNVKQITQITQNPMYTDYTFSNSNPGSKTVYVRFKSSTGVTETALATVQLMSAVTATPVPTVPPVGNNQQTLLKTYFLHEYPNWEYMKYQPRQFKVGTDADGWDKQVARVNNPGEYNGWDVLNTENYGIQTVMNAKKWFSITLNRPAVVAIVWRGGSQVPNWLTSSFTKASNVVVDNETYPTYKANLSAGVHDFGAVYEGSNLGSTPRDTYLILLAEANGQPSPELSVPAGFERPLPNQTCPSWVHDQYTTVGPDGKTYPAWHPQIDPVYWCYFRHEHGSDPKLFDANFNPPMGYAGLAGGVLGELHAGYKFYVWDDDYDQRWMVIHHFGTNTNQAACGRFHEFDVFMKNKATNEIMAKIYSMGDHGISMQITTGKPLVPTACPNQAEIAKVSSGIRGKRFISEGGGYEPWKVDTDGVLGLNFSSFTVNTPDAQVLCNDIKCDGFTPTGADGTLRFFGYQPGVGIRATSQASGTYYTDGYGKVLKNAGDANAVQQYIKPGANITSRIVGWQYTNTECYDVEMNGGLYVCGPDPLGAGPSTREGSIGIPN